MLINVFIRINYNFFNNPIIIVYNNNRVNFFILNYSYEDMMFHGQAHNKNNLNQGDTYSMRCKMDPNNIRIYDF